MNSINFPHYSQLKRNDCGPTCLRIISKYYGKTIEIEFVKNLCKLGEKGTSVSNLAFAAEQLGFRSMIFDISFDQLTKKTMLPCIVFLENKHFAVVYKITHKNIYVSDPAKTKNQKYGHDFFVSKFIDIASKTGTIICLEPQPCYYNTSGNGKSNNMPLSYLRIIFQYLKRYKSQLKQLTIVMLLITILQGTTPFIFRTVLDVGVDKKNIDFINVMFAANIIIMLSTGFANIVKDVITRHIGIRFGISIISNYLIRLLSMPLSYFNKLSSGEILNRVKDHENIKNFVLYHFVNFSYSILTFLILGFILYIFSLNVFLIFLFFTISYIIWILCFKRIQDNLEWSSHALHSKNNSFWIETIHNCNEIKSNNLEFYHRKKWEEIQTELYYQNINSAKIRNAQEAGSHIVNGTKNIIITFFCAKAVVHGDMTFGVFISIQFMIGFLNMPVNQFINFVQAYPAFKQSFKRLNDIHSNSFEKEIPDYCKFRGIPEFQSIILSKVYFKYLESNTYILRNISLTIPYGKTTAIIGKSGSGKSSLIKLLLGLYESSDGEIYLGNFLFKNIDIREFREQCGVVLQDGKIFHDSVLKNIVLKDENVDFKRLEEISQIVELNEIVKQLSSGYYSIIGGKGRKLSQGQVQRILLARALYKKPNYLFLDESTSALDIFNETVILQRIIKYMQNKTLVISTHRINTVEHVDQIIVLSDGTITEIGSHESLIARKGIYSMMHFLEKNKNIKQEIVNN